MPNASILLSSLAFDEAYFHTRAGTKIKQRKSVRLLQGESYILMYVEKCDHPSRFRFYKALVGEIYSCLWTYLHPLNASPREQKICNAFPLKSTYYCYYTLHNQQPGCLLYLILCWKTWRLKVILEMRKRQ
jgi:hypothetical protein